MIDKCEKCKYWQETPTHFGRSGECRINAPKSVDGKYISRTSLNLTPIGPGPYLQPDSSKLLNSVLNTEDK